MPTDNSWTKVHRPRSEWAQARVAAALLSTNGGHAGRFRLQFPAETSAGSEGRRIAPQQLARHRSKFRSREPRGLAFRNLRSASLPRPASECGSQDSNLRPRRSACETQLPPGIDFRSKYLPRRQIRDYRARGHVPAGERRFYVPTSDGQFSRLSGSWAGFPPLAAFRSKKLSTLSTTSSGVRAMCTMRRSSPPFPTPCVNQQANCFIFPMASGGLASRICL